jgi:hypothetical protein
MSRKTVVIPMHSKKKHHGKNPFAVSLEATQFALEQAVKEIVALQKQCDGLAKLAKEQDIQLNFQSGAIKRLRERVERMDGE